ncbi:MAG: hypothetical protein K6A63_01175 [Acholeplasmatales bacterium]|nr:hypothetical protein [Acholeplasmatales bacterium]
MSRKLTKAQKRKKKTQQRNKRIKKMESQDVRGISRQKITGTMDPKLFIILKVFSGLLIIFCYIFFSPVLLLAVIFNVFMILFAHKTEKKINHTFIKSNHMHIMKLDSIISILVILITIAGVAISSNSKKHIDSSNVEHTIVETIKNTGSCLTGNRSLFGGGMGMHFGTKDFDPSKMPNNMKEPPSMHEIDMSNIPLDVILSKMVSTINTVMIFMIPVADGITIYFYFRKKKKFDKEMNEVIDDTSTLTDEEFEELFMYGYEKIEENEISQLA